MKTFEMRVWSAQGPVLLIDVPQDCTLKKSEGPDFDVYYISRGSGATMGVYLGHHPNPRWPVGAQGRNQQVSGHDADWKEWQEVSDAGTVYYLEAIVDGFFSQPQPDLDLPPKPPPPPPAPPGLRSAVESLRMHLFISGTDRQEVEVLWRSAASLRIKPPS
jgi:hypothetical protein